MSATTNLGCSARNAPALAAVPDLSGHIPALDGIRGLAIVMVTAYRFNIGPDPDTRTGKLLAKVLSHGDLGVDLFFVLSGFLITGILYDTKSQKNYFRNFYARRMLRISPLYYGTLLACLVLLPWLGSQYDFFPEARAYQSWLWLYVSNFYLGCAGDWRLEGFTHFWSLAVEEQFYLAWPLMVWFCNRRQAMFVSLATILLAVGGRMVWLLLGGNSVAAETFTFFRLDSLGLGAFLALAARGPNGLPPLMRWAIGGGTLTSLSMAAIVVLPNKTLLGITMAILRGFFGALIVSAIAWESTTLGGRLWKSRLLRFFGKYSYAMYVFQCPLIVLMAPILTVEGLCLTFGSTTAGRWAYLAIMFTTTTALAYLSWHLYEKHFLALKWRFDEQKKQLARQTSPAVT